MTAAGPIPRQGRVVVVTRKSDYQQMVERRGTAGQARFYLRTRSESIESFETSHERLQTALGRVDAALPSDQRRVRLDRDELDRFLFAPDDIVVIVGQDGLVPNTAKYLTGQLVIGINPDPRRNDGVLCPHQPDRIRDLISWAVSPPSARSNTFRLQRRAMAVAVREDGQRLLSLNEIFIGHRTHQSARYRIISQGREERQSSSGVICSTGTGSTGWARSIAGQRRIGARLPGPEERALAWFVREPFPSVATGTDLDFGIVDADDSIELVSEMSEAGILFADGIETDTVEFLTGQRVRIEVAGITTNLVVPAARTVVTKLDRARRPIPHRSRAGSPEALR